MALKSKLIELSSDALRERGLNDEEALEAARDVVDAISDEVDVEDDDEEEEGEEDER